MPDQNTLSAYTLHRVIGRGNTSLVRLATDPRGQQVAVKIPHAETLAVQDSAELFGNEVRLTLQFRHPHLVQGFGELRSDRGPSWRCGTTRTAR
ncbi:hypothetical protein ACFQDE_09650 [Deinococcus caeni]|uniref:hypothetical protein n=1 Tax=Deinococcus caeni TaxID=569127 RepID=UPI00361A367A